MSGPVGGDQGFRATLIRPGQVWGSDSHKPEGPRTDGRWGRTEEVDRPRPLGHVPTVGGSSMGVEDGGFPGLKGKGLGSLPGFLS